MRKGTCSSWVAVGLAAAIAACGLEQSGTEAHDAGGRAAPAPLPTVDRGSSTGGAPGTPGNPGTPPPSTPPRTPVDASIPCPATTLAPGTHRGLRLTHAGETRTYDLHVPKGTAGDRPLPLVMSLHGATSNGWQQELTTGQSDLADTEGFLVVYPYGLDATWNAGTCCSDQPRDDVGFLRAMVGEIATQACVDRARVYATGISNGGHMSYRLACEAADLVAAVAPVAAHLTMPDPPDANAAKNFACAPSRPVPVLHVHGTGDTLVEYDETPQQIGKYDTGAPDTVAHMARLYHCSAGPTETWRAGADDWCEAYTQCDAASEVVLCTSKGGGHCWPGPAICWGPGRAMPQMDANAHLWEFFRRFHL